MSWDRVFYFLGCKMTIMSLEMTIKLGQQKMEVCNGKGKTGNYIYIFRNDN
ncbi:hypothetical protein Hanom_Chr07g00617911 [Helianthus anomalus]